MRPEERDAALLWDMLRFARETASFVDGRTWEEYQRDGLLRRAVERTVLMVGEAASRVSRTFRDAHAEIPWLPIIAQRHRLVHDYQRIDNEKIWCVATEHIPRLIVLLKPLIPPPPADSDSSDKEHQP
jgi:uncharacterized protein with HEPN domain